MMTHRFLAAARRILLGTQSRHDNLQINNFYAPCYSRY